MIPSDDQIERRLKATFESRAEEAPRIDLSQAALQQAGRIRTRRRIGAGMAVLIAVAVAVPVGIRFGDIGDHRQPTASGPTATEATERVAPTLAKTVDVEIAGLPAGAQPAVPYIDDNQFRYDGQTVSLQPTAGRITDATPFDEGPAVWSLDTSTGELQVSTNGVTSALPAGESASNPAFDPETGETAWAVQGVDADGAPSESETLILAKSFGGVAGATSAGDLQVEHVLGVHDGEVVFNAREDGTTTAATVDLRGVDPTIEQPWPGVASVTAVDPDFTKLAVVMTGDVGGSQRCSLMLSFDGATEEWSSCAWRPLEFSQDGARVLAVDSHGDGLGVREMAVLDSETGAVLGEFTTSGTFGRATFENTDTIVTVVAIGQQAAIVRCTIDGDCELATEPAKVKPDDPASLVTPYQITAN